VSGCGLSCAEAVRARRSSSVSTRPVAASRAALLRRILDQGSLLTEAGLIGLKTAVTELEAGPYSEDPWSKLVEVITLDQAARAFLP
jgi:hypothetical protein